MQTFFLPYLAMPITPTTNAQTNAMKPKIPANMTSDAPIALAVVSTSAATAKQATPRMQKNPNMIMSFLIGFRYFLIISSVIHANRPENFTNMEAKGKGLVKSNSFEEIINR